MEDSAREHRDAHPGGGRIRVLFRDRSASPNDPSVWEGISRMWAYRGEGRLLNLRQADGHKERETHDRSESVRALVRASGGAS